MKFSEKKINSGLLVTILTAILIFRYQVLSKFGFIYTDSDQAIMWQGLMDYSEGKFYEPRFYGQAYNSMLESLLAVPLYKIGVPFYKALPMVTSFLSLFPFVLISFLAFRKKSSSLGLLILSLPLLLPTEYALITSLSRGFVTGIFVASLGAISIFYKDKKWSFFLLGFVSILGFSINANSVLLSFPCLFYLFLFKYKNPPFYLYSGIGLMIGGTIHFWVNSFYIVNPFYNLHDYSLSYSFNLLIKSINNLDVFFNDVIPLFWNQGFIFLPIYLLISLLLIWKGKLKIGLVLLSIPVFIVLTTGISKVHDGTGSIFFPISRMYLAIPVIIAISLSFFNKRKFNSYYLIIPFFFFFYKSMHLDDSIIRNTSQNKRHVVAVDKVKTIIENCNNLSTLCVNYDVDLIVILNHYHYDFINYGCLACDEKFPPTLRPSYERRTWRLIEEEKRIHANILFLDNLNTLNDKFDAIERIENGKFLVKNNLLRTVPLLNKMDVKIRKYK